MEIYSSKLQDKLYPKAPGTSVDRASEPISRGPGFESPALSTQWWVPPKQPYPKGAGPAVTSKIPEWDNYNAQKNPACLKMMEER